MAVHVRGNSIYRSVRMALRRLRALEDQSLRIMKKLTAFILVVGFSSLLWHSGPPVAELMARSRRQANCVGFNIDAKASRPLRAVTLLSAPGGCHTRIMNGLPIPDPNCTPGAINPTVTVAELRDPAFRTACIRQQVTTEQEKAQTYRRYSIPHPANNSGGSQSCELDHLVPLELGGADTLDNIWPMCGPPGVPLAERYFKQKDVVENYLAWRVRRGELDLAQAQRGIATNWTQYLADAKQYCTSERCQ